MAWSEWRPIDRRCAHKGAAVYEVRMTNAHGDPVPIERFLATDARGQLMIGETERMEYRRKQFNRGLEGRRGHSAGNLLHFVIRHSLVNECFPKHKLEYRVHWKADKNCAKAAEAAQMKAYERKFGEVPPLNSAIPDRYNNWIVAEDC